MKSGNKLAVELLKYWLQIKHKKGIGEGHVTRKEECSDIQFWNLPWVVETNQASFSQNIFTTRRSSALVLYLKCKHRCRRAS